MCGTRSDPSTTRFLSMSNVDVRWMVCPANPESNVTVSPLDAAAMASRNEQSELQTPSSVSTVLVTIKDAAIAMETEPASSTRIKISDNRNRNSFMVDLLKFQGK